MSLHQRDVAARHLLRLGSGEADLHSAEGSLANPNNEVFSRQGRVNWSLNRRLQLLGQVYRLASSLQIVGDYGSNCETAEYFYKQHIETRIQQFHSEVNKMSTNATTTTTATSTDDVNTSTKSVADIFPFSSYFADVPTPLFTGVRDSDVEAAILCVNHINRLFEELQDYR